MPEHLQGFEAVGVEAPLVADAPQAGDDEGRLLGGGGAGGDEAVPEALADEGGEVGPPSVLAPLPGDLGGSIPGVMRGEDQPVGVEGVGTPLLRANPVGYHTGRDPMDQFVSADLPCA